MVPYQDRRFLYKAEMVVRLTYLYNGDYLTSKMAFFNIDSTRWSIKVVLNQIDLKEYSWVLLYAEPTKDTPYLALTDELWGVFVNILEKIDCVITAPHRIYFSASTAAIDGQVPFRAGIVWFLHTYRGRVLYELIHYGLVLPYGNLRQHLFMYLMVPSYYLNQCCLEIIWHPS